MRPPVSVRVYRDDNLFYDESEYLAVVGSKDCFLVDLVSVQLPEWEHAVLRFICPISLTPDPGLLNNTTSALAGWHFLLDTEHIQEVENWEVVEQRTPADVVISAQIYPPSYRKEEATLHTGQLVKAIHERMKPTPQADYPYSPRFPLYLGCRFTDEQLTEAISALSQGKTVEFRYQEYGMAINTPD
jgi:hypothetical protein